MTASPDRALFIGLMSGTSADGMDAALVRFAEEKPEISGRLSHSYPDALRERIRRAATASSLEFAEVMRLDRELGDLAARLALQLLQDAGVPASAVAAIGSHGQTIRHLPEDACTWQIGDPNRIAQCTGITTIADFRRRDLAAGGEGAPLAPAFHAAVFRSEGVTRAIVNLGGIANVTHLPADPARPVTGYDTGPANRLLDHWCRRHRRTPFDSGGAWAAGGSVHRPLLENMLADPYFEAPAPKSTGPEYFSDDWLQAHLDHCPDLAPEDVQATLLQLTVQSVAREIRRLQPGVQEVYLCGGGAGNTFLVQELAHALQPAPVTDTAALGVPPQLVEPVAFAWLARQTLLHRAGNLPSVTGARQPVILGGIYPA